MTQYSRIPVNEKRGLPSCTATVTKDLLDCDCGQITRQMKIRILAERDQHAAAHGQPS